MPAVFEVFNFSCGTPFYSRRLIELYGAKCTCLVKFKTDATRGRESSAWCHGTRKDQSERNFIVQPPSFKQEVFQNYTMRRRTTSIRLANQS